MEQINKINNINKINIEELRTVDILTVKRKELHDINEVRLDPAMPIAERRKSFVEQIKNPYCFKCGNMIIKIEHGHAGLSLEECFLSYLSSETI